MNVTSTLNTTTASFVMTSADSATAAASDLVDDALTSSSSENASSTSSSYIAVDETTFERLSDVALGIAFIVTATIAAKRMYVNSRQLAQAAALSRNGGSSGGSGSATSSGGGAETTVVTAFYSLILATSVLRAIWFIVPVIVVEVLLSQQKHLSTGSTADSHPRLQPILQYTPVAVYAWNRQDSQHLARGADDDSSSQYPTTTTTSWVWYAVSELVVTAGSLTLFSIFILILVYWADILKKYYNPGSRRSLPMATFLGLVATLVGLEFLNLLLFLLGLYSTEGMILFDAILLATVSIICVCEITIFSRKFQNVLKTLGAINQVSTDSQIRRIVWITVTGNLFFFTRAMLETAFASTLLFYYVHHGSIDRVFSHAWWDTYELLKYWSEITILALMLHILQSRFSSSAAASNTSRLSQYASQSNTAGYSKIPDASVNV